MLRDCTGSKLTFLDCRECSGSLLTTEIQHWRNKLLPVAAEFRGQVTMAMSDEEEFHQEMVLMGLGDWGEDVAVGLWAGPREKYRLNDELSEGALREFLEVGGDRRGYFRYKQWSIFV